MIIYLMILHFIADFLLQSREMGKKKSSEFLWLLKHLGIQYTIMIIGLTPCFFLNLISAHKLLALCILNTIIHGVIDWNIWNVYKYSVKIRLINHYKDTGVHENHIKKAGSNWEYWEDHWFYTTIGFDQLLHASTLVILWSVL